MRTVLLKASPATISRAAAIIRQGGLVAFPTETVYGLGADALNPAAVRRIFRAKGRPADNPMIVHVARTRDVQPLTRRITPIANRLMKKFWPGPLTLVLKKSKAVPGIVTGGLDSVAVRMPAHPVALALICAAGTPIAAPSANRSGLPSPTSARHVWLDLDGRINAILDGGTTPIGVESTVLDLTTAMPILLRPGKITLEQLQTVVGSIVLHPRHGHAPRLIRSPGMKYRHYAPKAEMILVEGTSASIQKFIDRYRRQKKKVGVLAFRHRYRADAVRFYGTRRSAIARNLFAVLREFDGKKMDVILSDTLPRKGLGLAIMDRLERAAGNRIMRV